MVIYFDLASLIAQATELPEAKLVLVAGTLDGVKCWAIDWRN